MNDDRVRTWESWHHECTPAERALWCAWLRRHGIDPGDVASTEARVERRPEDFQIIYRSYEWDDDGSLRLVDGEPIPVDRVFQMEAPPLDFPTTTRRR